MPVSINNMTVNTTVNKEGTTEAPAKEGGGGVSKAEKEKIIRECLERVKEMLEYELKP